MTPRLQHPLWTHAPAAILVVAILSSFWSVWPIPDPAPVHFGSDGSPERMGAFWEMPLVMALVSLVALGVSVAVDEAWARQERRKRFNLFALGDETLLAFLTATTVDYVETIRRGEPYVLQSSWASTAGLVAAAVLLATALEALRPFRPGGTLLEPEPVEDLEEEITRRHRRGTPWVYWESQNPRYARLLLPVMGLGLVALGFTSWSENRWASSAAFAGGLLVLLLGAGGLRVSVTEKRLRVSVGLLDLRLLELPLEDVASAEVHTFSPLADFGGYGIRRNREMTAYFLEGERGIKLTTTAGKKYVIGSRHPEQLAALILTAAQFTR